MSGPLTVGRIQEETATQYSVGVQELLGPGKSKTVAHARRVAILIARKCLHWSSHELGRAFDRDHTTVLQACKYMQARYDTDPKVRADVAEICARLGMVHDGQADKAS